MALVARTYRGAIPDLEHHGRVAVVDWRGRLLWYYGDPRALTFARSGAKPMQAVPLCESGALEAYGVTDRELAVICASHNGQPEHVALVEGILKKAGLSPGALLCGAEYPIHEQTKWDMIRHGQGPDCLHCDCSGKHAGMLLTARRYGEDLACYPRPDSPTQQRIIRAICRLCDCEPGGITQAVDGCGVPVHALPLYKLAQGYARMSRPEVLEPELGEAAERIVRAMTAYPFEVAGTGRLCTGLMRAFGARLFGKSGAASFYGIGLRGRGIGIAVKLEDGCSEFMPGVVLEILTQLGVISREEWSLLEDCWDPNIYNHHRQVVGRREIDFTLLPGNAQAGGALV